MIVLGGVDPNLKSQETFTDKVYSLYEVGNSALTKMYFSDQLMSMITPRGCFTAVCFDDKIFVIGGINNTERFLDKCEIFSKFADCWHPMPALNIARNNASSVRLNNDSVYCFGGSNQTGIIDSIEMFSFSLNEWKILEIKLPNPVSLCCSFRINDNKILIMGGLIKENSEKVNPYKSNQVLVFDTLVPNFYQSPTNLSED